MLLALGLALALQEPQVVQGVVRDGQRKPVVEATVEVTGVMSGARRVTRTDRDGRFRVVFLVDEPSYRVFTQKVGHAPAIQTVQRKPGSVTISADVLLVEAPLALAPIEVVAPRSSPLLRSERLSTGGSGAVLDGEQFLVENAADLDAVLALVPGVQGTEEGFSVFGAPASQNARLLDGMRFDGSFLPPDAVCSTTFSTSTTTVGRGEFAGGQSSLQGCAGRTVTEARLRVAQQHPTLSWSDAAAVRGTPRTTIASGFIGGPIRTGVASYRLSFAWEQQRADAASLLEPRTPILTGVGLTLDQLSGLRQDASALGLDLGSPTPARDDRRDRASAYLVGDWTVGSSSSLRLTGYAARSRTTPDIGSLAAPTRVATLATDEARLMLRGSTWLLGAVSEATLSWAERTSERTPTSEAPAASVRLAGVTDDGLQTLVPVALGGSGFRSRSTDATWELRHELLRITPSGRHRLTFGQQVRHESVNRRTDIGTNGAFTYDDAAAFRLNRPSAYSRVVAPTTGAGATTALAAWFGDVTRVTDRLSLEGGLRLDHYRYAELPARNGAVFDRFGLRTDRVPSSTQFSPRIGGAWLVARRTEQRVPGRPGLGMAQVIDLYEALGLPRTNFGGGITLAASVGAYRGVLPTARLAALGPLSGIGLGTAVLQCTGAAAPIPNWRAADGTTFDRCADGTVPPVFATTQRAIEVFDASYRPPTSWRGTLALNGLTSGLWSGDVELTWSEGRSVESRIDRNLVATPRFALAGEGGRPVFAGVDEIDAGSGRVAPGAGRVDPTFGTVDVVRSDLRSRALEARVRFYPPPLVDRLLIGFTYLWSHQRIEARGFEATTAGDPFAREMIAGFQPTHQLVAAIGTTISGVRLGVRVNVQSGFPYTPVVVGDVNGDGRQNDRAFIPSDGASLARLLEVAPSGARACLASQRGRIAAPASCRGPWQARFDLAVDFEPPGVRQVDDRLRVSLRFINAGGALARLVGANPSLIQGTQLPDPRLLFVTGFDPATRAYRYAVNETFGQPFAGGSRARGFPPFQLQLGASYTFGGSARPTVLRRNGLLRGGRFADDAPAQLRARLDNPVHQLLARGDSLALSKVQRDSLVRLAARVDARLDSLVAAVAPEIAPAARADDARIETRVAEVIGAGYGIRAAARRAALAVLRDDQRRKLIQLEQAEGG